ncbi:MAG TPA: protein kinase [Myxococcota bacterium]
MSERFGEYELIRHIATGGMAEIFIARHRTGGLDRVLVIKRMLPELAVRPDFVQMFLDEARLTSSLQHLHVVRVFDLGQAEGSYFIAMELVDGPHLGALFAQSLRARRPLPIELCAWIVARAADGLHYAHDVNDPASGQALELVHRDISPQNILVGKNGEVKVTDFGVAKASTQQTKTRTGIVKGKVSYMSPEQCLGEQVDRRTDVFALGIVLYELLTRRRLFRDKSDLLIMQRITGEDVAAASTVNPAVNAELDAIVKRALSRRLDERYGTAAELAVALDAWLADNKRPADELSLQTWFAANCPELSPTATLNLASEATVAAPFPMPSTARQASSTSQTPSFSKRLAASTVAFGDDVGSSDEGPGLRDEATAISLPPRFEPVLTSRPGEQNLLVEPPTTAPATRGGLDADDDLGGVPDAPTMTSSRATSSGRLSTRTPSDKRAPPINSGAFPPVQRASSGTFTPVTSSTTAMMPPGTRLRTKHLPWAAGGAAFAVFLVLVVGFGMQRQRLARLQATPLPPVTTSTSTATGGAQGAAVLVVDTVPAGATILVDDRVVGTAPLRAPHAAGKAVVVAQFPEQPPQRLDVEVGAAGDVAVRFEARVPLRVTSTPSRAKVRVNGALVGETPFDRGYLVTPGEALEIAVEPGAGWQSWQQTHTAVAGDPLLVDAVLTPAAKDRAPVRVVDEGRGALSVRTEPWALVRLDKDVVGETPFVDRPVKAGKHVLSLKNPDVGLDERITITVPKDKTLAVILKFEKVGAVWKLKSKTIR